MNPLFIGIPKETELNERKRLVLVNVLTIMGVSINILYFLFLISMGKFLLSSINLTCGIIIGAIGFYLMKTRKYNSAKVFILFATPIVLFLFCTIYGDLGFNLYFVLLSISSFFILDNKTSILLTNLWIFIVFLFLNIGIATKIIMPCDENIAYWSQLFYWSNLVTGFICNFIVLTIFKAENLRYEISLKEKSTQILLQNEEILTQRDLLDKINFTKNKLFSIIAHDLKNPFIGMIHSSEVLLDEIKGNSVKKEELLYIIRNIQLSTQNGLKLLENLLDWSRSQTDEIICRPNKVYINEVITECITSLKSFIDNKHIKLSFDDKPNLVWADKHMLNSIIRNLLSNAIKYTKIDGSISIEITDKDDFLEVKVSDTGVGISEEFKNKLFGTEFIDTTLGTQDEKGTGLGLLICKSFTTKNGGNIWAESELGKGSTFYFTVPKVKKT